MSKSTRKAIGLVRSESRALAPSVFTGGCASLRPRIIKVLSLVARLVALLVLNALLWSQGLIHHGHAPLSSSSHFSKWPLRPLPRRDSPSDLLRFSWLSRLHHTYNEGPGEVREWCMSKIHGQYISILNLPQRESIVVPVACVWSMSNSHILSRTCNLISSPVPPLGHLSWYSSVSCPGLNYRFPPLTSTLRTPFPSKPYNFSTLESFRIVKLSVYPDSCVPNFCDFDGPVSFCILSRVI